MFQTDGSSLTFLFELSIERLTLNKQTTTKGNKPNHENHRPKECIA